MQALCFFNHELTANSWHLALKARVCWSVDKLQDRVSTTRSSKEADEAMVSSFSNTQLVVEMLLMWKHLPVDSSIFIINKKNWSVQYG